VIFGRSKFWKLGLQVKKFILRKNRIRNINRFYEFKWEIKTNKPVMKFYKNRALTAIILIVAVFISCNDNNTSEVTPEIPSAQTMAIDLSDFNSNNNPKLKAGSNFNAALFRAGVAKLIVDANLIVPRVLITAAQDKDPEVVAEGEYQWMYSAENGEDEFSILLTAKVDSEDDVEWNFYVTSSANDPPLNNFLLFRGEAEYDGSEGNWTYFDAQETGPVSEIEWDIDNDGAVDLDFSVLSDRNGNEGSEIDYDFDGTTKTIVYIDGSNEEATTIEFNTETKVGFIISPNYNDGIKSCWDENFEDTPCPS
jgi:hypothetical protein